MELSGLRPQRALTLRACSAPPKRHRLLGPGLLACSRPLTTVTAVRASQHPHPAPEQSSPEVRDLIRWLRKGGGRVSGVRVVADPVVGYKLVANRAIKEEELLVEVPDACTLYSNLAGSAHRTIFSNLSALQRLYNTTPTYLVKSAVDLSLLVAVGRAKGRISKWRPYLDCLPADASSIPHMWPEKDIQALQHKPTIEAVTQRRQWLQDFAAAVASNNAQVCGVEIDVELLGWALAMVTPRGINDDNFEGSGCLQPLLDFCRLSAAPNCGAHNCVSAIVPRLEGRRWKEIKGLMATRDIAKDEPLTLAHAIYDNTYMLLNLGFLVPGNENGAVSFLYSLRDLQKLACRLSGEPVPEGFQMWRYHAVFERGASSSPLSPVLVTFTHAGLPDSLAAASRALCSTSEADLQGRQGKKLGILDWPLAQEIEVKALRLMAAVCEQQLEGMTASTEEDRRILASPKPQLSRSQELAVRYRLGAKEAFTKAQGQIDAKLRALRS